MTSDDDEAERKSWCLNADITIKVTAINNISKLPVSNELLPLKSDVKCTLTAHGK